MEMTDQLQQTAREIEERVRPQIDEAKRRLGDMNEQMKAYIRENPGKCLLGAIAAGYLIGRIARRF